MLEHLRRWMYRNARPIDLAMWQFHFEGGSQEAVLTALSAYQNPDGGFGHALEADNWSPHSSPATTCHAIKLLHQIGFADMAHPIYQGIWRYLASGDGLLPYGWAFSMPANDAYPRAPWWTYGEAANTKEHYGVTAELSAFILRYGERDSALWRQACAFADLLLPLLSTDAGYGDMGLQGYVELVAAAQAAALPGYDYAALQSILARKVHEAILRDKDKWAGYCVRPSYFITSPDSPFYAENAELVQAELDFLTTSLPENDVWGIPWRWYGMPQYDREFHVSETWWKGVRVVEFALMLRAFGRV